MHDLGMPRQWQDLPRVVTWFDNIRAQPAFKPTYYHGSLLSERFPHLREKATASAGSQYKRNDRRDARREWRAAQYFALIGNSSAGNSEIRRQPLSVTTTSSSMRAAEKPSVAGQ